MNDDQLLTAVRTSLTGVKDSLTDVHLDRPVSAITGPARAQRLRRGLLGGATAAALGAGLFFGLTAGPASPPPVHVSLDAWSVSTTPSGKVELTIRELKDQALLERTLADAGVPAIVRFGEFCEASRQADNLTGLAGVGFLGRPVARHGVLVSIFINPAAIASGAKVSIGVEGMSGDHGMFEDQVIKDGAPLTCHPIDVSR